MDIKVFILRKKFWINDFLGGGAVWKALQEIKYINNNIKRGEHIRKQRLDELLKFAKKHTRFYSTILGENLADFPVINKNTILNNREDFIVRPEEIPGQIGKLHIQSTSG